MDSSCCSDFLESQLSRCGDHTEAPAALGKATRSRPQQLAGLQDFETLKRRSRVRRQKKSRQEAAGDVFRARVDPQHPRIRARGGLGRGLWAIELLMLLEYGQHSATLRSRGKKLPL